MNNLLIIEQDGPIKVYQTDKGEKVVSGRELHQGLGVVKKFTDWIDNNLANVDASENEDYILLHFKGKQNGSGGHNKKDYILKIDIAKEICMVAGASPRANAELKKKSKNYRKFLIDVEKKYKQSVPKIDSRFLFQLAQQLEEKEKQITSLNTENDLLSTRQLHWTTRKTIEAIIKKIGGTFDYKEAWRGFKAEFIV